MIVNLLKRKNFCFLFLLSKFFIVFFSCFGSKNDVVLVLGPPGSGKTSLIASSFMDYEFVKNEDGDLVYHSKYSNREKPLVGLGDNDDAVTSKCSFYNYRSSFFNEQNEEEKVNINICDTRGIYSHGNITEKQKIENKYSKEEIGRIIKRDNIKGILFVFDVSSFSGRNSAPFLFFLNELVHFLPEDKKIRKYWGKSVSMIITRTENSRGIQRTVKQNFSAISEKLHSESVNTISLNKKKEFVSIFLKQLFDDKGWKGSINKENVFFYDPIVDDQGGKNTKSFKKILMKINSFEGIKSENFFSPVIVNEEPKINNEEDQSKKWFFINTFCEKVNTYKYHLSLLTLFAVNLYLIYNLRKEKKEATKEIVTLYKDILKKLDTHNNHLINLLDNHKQNIIEEINSHGTSAINSLSEYMKNLPYYLDKCLSIN